MTWSGGTTPIPDGDRVDPLPAELRADLDRPYDPQQHDGYPARWKARWRQACTDHHIDQVLFWLALVGMAALVIFGTITSPGHPSQ